jgi:glutamate transport system permease protein
VQLSTITDNLDVYLEGFVGTLKLTALGATGSLVLGTVLATMRVSPVPSLRAAATGYVEILRNCPLPVLAVLLAFGLPKLGPPIQGFSFFTWAVIAIALYHAAFVCEALRSGVNSVSPGQGEAARSLGLTFGQTMSLVVLPQAFRTVVPPLGSVLIAMAKNTSIAAGFSISEVSSLLARLSNADPNDLLFILLGVVLAYMIITVPAAIALNRIEHRVAILR